MYKILIVDDEPHIRILLEETLEDFEEKGVEIITAKDGLEAVNCIMSQKPNLVYLDIMMPEMNGYEVCKKIKIDEGMKDVYIVMLTAKGQVVDKEKGIETGVDMYITKPFDPDFIIKNTENILGMQL
jgi:DNA-binding response OmpR family regulator